MSHTPSVASLCERRRRIPVSVRALRAALVGVLSAAIPIPMTAQSSASVLPAPAAIPRFSVRDQFDRALTTENVAGTPVLFLVASRQGATNARRWSIFLREPARGRGVRVVNVADLKGVPGLLRGIIRRDFPKDTADAILMDFEGRLGRTLRGDRAALVAVGYGADGRLQRALELPGSGPDATIADQLLGPPRRR